MSSTTVGRSSGLLRTLHNPKPLGIGCGCNSPVFISSCKGREELVRKRHSSGFGKSIETKTTVEAVRECNFKTEATAAAEQREVCRAGKCAGNQEATVRAATRESEFKSLFFQTWMFVCQHANFVSDLRCQSYFLAQACPETEFDERVSAIWLGPRLSCRGTR